MKSSKNKHVDGLILAEAIKPATQAVLRQALKRAVELDNTTAMRLNHFIASARHNLSRKNWDRAFSDVNGALRLTGRTGDLAEALWAARSAILKKNELGTVQNLDLASSRLSSREAKQIPRSQWKQDPKGTPVKSLGTDKMKALASQHGYQWKGGGAIRKDGPVTAIVTYDNGRLHYHVKVNGMTSLKGSVSSSASTSLFRDLDKAIERGKSKAGESVKEALLSWQSHRTGFGEKQKWVGQIDGKWDYKPYPGTGRVFMNVTLHPRGNQWEIVAGFAGNSGVTVGRADSISMAKFKAQQFVEKNLIPLKEAVREARTPAQISQQLRRMRNNMMRLRSDFQDIYGEISTLHQTVEVMAREAPDGHGKDALKQGASSGRALYNELVVQSRKFMEFDEWLAEAAEQLDIQGGR